MTDASGQELDPPNITRVRVRYGECDMQGVVFNANYLAYGDDAIDRWFRATIGVVGERMKLVDDFEPMVKTATLDFSRSLVFGDEAHLECAVSRWGRSSMDVTVTGTVAGEPRFVLTLVYVSVNLSTMRPTPIPDSVRSALA